MNCIRTKYLTLFVSLVSVLTIAGYFYFEFDERVLLGILGIIATMYFGTLRIKIEQDKLFKELFTDFNSKYNDKINDLINELRGDPSKTLKQNEKQLLIDYFNLCSEEYLWKKKDRIPPDVWEAWKAGIEANLEITQVKELFNNEAKDKRTRKSYYGLLEELGWK